VQKRNCLNVKLAVPKAQQKLSAPNVLKRKKQSLKLQPKRKLNRSDLLGGCYLVLPIKF
jgi:hypothetical protein